MSIGVEERRRRFHNNRAEQTAVVYRIDPFPLRVLGLPLSSDLSFFSGYTVFFQGTELSSEFLLKGTHNTVSSQSTGLISEFLLRVLGLVVSFISEYWA